MVRSWSQRVLAGGYGAFFAAAISFLFSTGCAHRTVSFPGGLTPALKYTPRIPQFIDVDEFSIYLSKKLPQKITRRQRKSKPLREPSPIEGIRKLASVFIDPIIENASVTTGNSKIPSDSEIPGSAFSAERPWKSNRKGTVGREKSTSQNGSEKTYFEIPEGKPRLRTTKTFKTKLLRPELINLNPQINKWFIIKTRGKDSKTFHIENVMPVNLLRANEKGITILNSKTGQTTECPLWDPAVNDIRTVNFNAYRYPYFPLCAGLMYVRLKRYSTTKLSLTEWATEKLRKISFGEEIINFVKPIIVATKAEAANNKMIAPSQQRGASGSPGGASIYRRYQQVPVSVENHLGFKIHNPESFIRYGNWYRTKMHQGIYISLMIPALVDPKILVNSYSPKHRSIPGSESDKLVYLVSYDLSRYSVNFVHGTAYPGLPEHSPHGNQATTEDLVMAGTVPPYMINRSVGVFVGGFKRSHGYFKYGEHQGKHYGYIENGVVLSKMESELATIYSTKNGNVHIARWPSRGQRENELLRQVVSARQNGVLLIENYGPGKYVHSWGGGNWSGNVNGNLKTLRSAICVQNRNGRKHLLFAAFTSATPSTMAKVLQAYSCESALQLDMNAYMYLHNAIYDFNNNKNINIEYLHTEMEYPRGLTHHRYIMDNNNRDFFYVYKHHESPERKLRASFPE